MLTLQFRPTALVARPTVLLLVEPAGRLAVKNCRVDTERVVGTDRAVPGGDAMLAAGFVRLPFKLSNMHICEGNTLTTGA